MKNKNLRFHVKVWRRMRKLENVFLLLLGFIQSSNGLYGGVDWTYRNDMRTKGFLISKSTRSVCKKLGGLEFPWSIFGEFFMMQGTARKDRAARHGHANSRLFQPPQNNLEFGNTLYLCCAGYHFNGQICFMNKKLCIK